MEIKNLCYEILEGMDKSLEISMKKASPLWQNVIVFLLFACFAFVSNWSLILGENLMKWDIWQAEYPLQMLMSDALKNHTIPLWNPLMRYGTPNYAMTGTPVWYPFTLLLALFGYKPNTIAISYAMHIAIGGYGMFLLVKNENVAYENYHFSTAMIAGLLYAGHGLFLSNAEHIMIIISAAWFPYVFLFARRYVEENVLLYGLLAGLSAAMILLGGYPEMFYDLFLFLMVYVLFFSFRKFRAVQKSLIVFLKKYFLICVATVSASAILLIPFLKNMSLITRGSGLGQNPETKPLMTLLSFFLPGTASYLPTGEVSMSNFYVGLLVILLLPLVVNKCSNTNKWYLALAFFAFLLCWGRGSFVHSLLYRFLPMYKTFRFPMLNRSAVAIFMILAVVPGINALLAGHVSSRTVFWNKLLIGLIGIVALIGTFFCSFYKDTSNVNVELLRKFVDAAWIAEIFLLMWLFVFSSLSHSGMNLRITQFLVTGAVVLELLAFSFVEMPITISTFHVTDYARDLTVKNRIDEEFEINRTRNRSINFSGHTRSTSGLDSKRIVLSKTFDEEGYLSFRLQSTDNFLQTYNRSIIEPNPVAYFTNNIVTEQEKSYDDWVNAPDIPPEQIFAQKKPDVQDSDIVQFETQERFQQDLPLQVNRNEVVLCELANLPVDQTRRIRIYYDNSNHTKLPLQIIFTLDDGSEQVASGEYSLQAKKGVFYVEVSFPSVEKSYQSVRIVTDGVLPVSASYVTVERMSEDAYVDVYDFGFNSIGMNVTAPTDGYVTLLQAKHDGWVAYVDGEKQEIDAVNGCFMGLYVEKGSHSIILRFRPYDFFAGACISALFAVVLCVQMCSRFWCSKKSRMGFPSRKQFGTNQIS